MGRRRSCRICVNAGSTASFWGTVLHLFICNPYNNHSAVTLEHAVIAFLTKMSNGKLHKTMKKINKGNKGGFGEYTPEGVAKKKLQDKRDEQAVNSANNEPKDCGCC